MVRDRPTASGTPAHRTPGSPHAAVVSVDAGMPRAHAGLGEGSPNHDYSAFPCRSIVSGMSYPPLVNAYSSLLTRNVTTPTHMRSHACPSRTLAGLDGGLHIGDGRAGAKLQHVLAVCEMKRRKSVSVDGS